MWKIKIRNVAGMAVLCALLMTAGCADRSEQAPRTAVQPGGQKLPVELALKFVPQDSTTYRITKENDKSVKWEGPAESTPKSFTGGHTGSRIEMTFTQHIQGTDDKGNAVAKITIKDLKYLTRVKDQAVLDFDSSREKDLGTALGKLIGQSYIVELTDSGQVSKVIDANAARAAVQGNSSAHKTAANLLSADTIREMHTLSALPAAGKQQVHTGESWSSIESFSFDLMGVKSYEKIYTLKEIQKTGNRSVAIARMEAVPSAQMAKELHKEQQTASFSNMFDNTETYTGELKLSLTDGKIEQWREELLIEWFIVDPNPQDKQQPAALKMTAARLHRIERVG
jgi:hypothetical protein